MSTEINVLSENVNIKNSNGDVITSVPVLDMYYSIAMSSEEAGPVSQINKLKYAANYINEQYGTNFSWGEVLDLLNQLDPIVSGAKKNTIDTPESPSGTESTPSS